MNKVRRISLLKPHSTVPLRRPMCKKPCSDDDNLNYCTNIVRQHDYENFLATLLLPKAIRSPALVVRAFNVEVARVQDQTTDIQSSTFRLQFWDDTLQKIYKSNTLQSVPANPVAQELYKVSLCYKLPKRHLEKLITSRHNLLKTKHFASLEAIENYAEATVSSIYYILLKVAEVTNINADHAASHIGKAQGIVNILRSIHVSNHHKMVTLPMDILMNNKISQEDVLRCRDDDRMRNVVFEVATRANNHLKKARSINIPDVCNQMFLPATAVEDYLKRLQKHDFNIFEEKLRYGNTFLPLSLYYRRLLNRY